MSVDTSIIIVNWNSKDYLRQCLRSLDAHLPSVAFEVIVVDGASFDGCGEMLAAEFPKVVFIQSNENIGFAKANNLGARRAKGEYLLLLNPDTEFTEDAITTLHACAKSHEDAGAIGCRLLNGDRSLQTSCVQAFPTVLNQALDSEFLRRKSPRSKLWGISALYDESPSAIPVEAISGACIYVKRSRYEQVGGFTEQYFMYGEDIDLCFKLTNAGFRSYYLHNPSLIHYGGASTQKAASNFSMVMMRSSVHRFFAMHHGPIAAFAYRFTTAISALLRLGSILPLLIFGDRIVSHGKDSLRKWSAILGWCLGRPAKRPAPRTTATTTTQPELIK